MIGVDWFAVAVLGVAYALSQVRAIPAHLRHFIFAAALFAVAGNRISRGAEGLNVIFALVAAGFGVSSVVQGVRALKMRAPTSSDRKE